MPLQLTRVNKMKLDVRLQRYDQCKTSLTKSLGDYQCWLDDANLSDVETEMMLLKNQRLVEKDSITIAFVAEFSRGKTELINALFFSATGVRLLPSSPGRTTMCPTELLYDKKEKPYLRLLEIDTRLNDRSIEDYKKQPKQWTHIELDDSNPKQMQQALLELLKTKTVSIEKAKQLGFAANDADESVEVPFWRHAVVSFPHPLLKKGLTILDTPGLNALGSEPELTLSMLPNAQGLVFVLAADTGVTQSDMSMWQQHIRTYKNTHAHGLAVVLNKIDAINDELMSADECAQLIEKQSLETARLLELDKSLVFPLSAKQGLVAKIKQDAELLVDSRLSALENYLSDSVLSAQKERLLDEVVAGVVVHMSMVQKTLQARLLRLDEHLNELRAIHGKSKQATAELLLETRQQQTLYNKNVEHLKTCRHIFNSQMGDLLYLVNADKVAEVFNAGREQMMHSWTIKGIRMGMRHTFDELNTLLSEMLNSAQSSAKLLDTIYKRFKDEHHLNVVQPERFDIEVCQHQLGDLLHEGLEFSQSSEAVLTEQNALARRFVDTIGGRARAIFEQASVDVKTWQSSALAPLIREVNEQKRLMESKLDSLRNVSANKIVLDEKIAANVSNAENIRHKLQALDGLIASMSTSQDETEPLVREATN